MKNQGNNMISDWLEKNGDPAIEKLTQMNLAIATRINDILVEKGLKAVDLAKMLDKSSSEISKWLTGTHTFTTKTLAKISVKLGEEIIFTEPQIKKVYFTAYVNNPITDTSYEKSEVFLTKAEADKKAS